MYFKDSKSNHDGVNHVLSQTKTAGKNGWFNISGSYTPLSTAVSPDADLAGAGFYIYINPVNGRNLIFMIDNVKLYYIDNELLDGVNYLTNGSFENTQNIEFVACNATTPTLTPGNPDASDGIYSLRVSGDAYSHAGFALKLEKDRTYEYSYDIKLISDINGNSITNPVMAYTNFVFPDSAASLKRNHPIGGVALISDTGWKHISGTFCPADVNPSADADFNNAYFSVYTNPIGSVGTVWLIDNVVFKRIALENEKTTFVLPSMLSDNMLLQRGEPIPVWGTSSNTSPITIKLLNGETVISQGSAVPLSNGNFEASLPVVDAYHKSLSLKFYSGDELIKTVKNVAIGELWHFSGQSNMALTIKSCGTYSDEIFTDDPNGYIRYFNVGEGGSDAWVVVTPDGAKSMSAVAVSTMDTIFKGLGNAVPVGCLNTAAGGKTMSVYTGNSGELFKSRVAFAAKLPVKGHFWYQGESDTFNANFASQFKALISSWRSEWNKPSHPFIFVQLPQSCATIPDWWGMLDSNGNPTRRSTYDYTNARFYQLKTYLDMRSDNVGMIVAFDTTEKITEQKSLENLNAEDPLHPWNKKPIGERLGNYALNEIYGKNYVKHLSPVAESAYFKNGGALVKFSGAYDGLFTNDGLSPRYFELAGADGIYHKATTVEIISKDSIYIICDEVENPKYVAYAYETHHVVMSHSFTGMDVNLVNSAGLPASPFYMEITALKGDASKDGEITTLDA